MASDKQVEIDGNLKINGNMSLNETTGKIDKTVFNLIYPAGSYYWTSDSAFNPNNSFGGVWTRVKDKMLMALGDSFTSDGGSDTRQFKLEVTNLPSHTHNISHTHDLIPEGELIELSFDGTKTKTENESGHTHGLGRMNFTGGAVIRGAESLWSLEDYPKNCFSLGDSSWSKYSGHSSGNGDNARMVFNAANGWNGEPTGSGSSHSHSYTPSGTVSGSFKGLSTTTSSQNTSTSGPTGGESAMNLMPPYKVAYLWHRDS